MIRRLLIANRGEIAARIARTCRRLGIRSVAVYSDADRDSPHVAACDEAHRIGPAAPAASYLSIEALLAAARASGADAVHPGYGFLAENADFAAACVDAGLVFVGPSAAAIRAMGTKESSRRLAAEIGVPIIPGWHGAAADDAALAREAAHVGLPLLVKASAGGGGKGIRVVTERAELESALATARREARSAFGDETLILERYLGGARHVEVQVIGDRHGRRLALFDRDCSIQRRHQKVVEEAPAPGIPGATRASMREAALRLADAIDYDNAGTVEFLYDEAAGEFFLLEMNTRLQVEHPTTELVSGIDLVEWQLRVAAGEPLPERLGADAPVGAAIEVRVCAEKPAQDFAPAIGTVRRFAVPPIEGVRVDSGIAPGTVVGATYDSMLAKIVAHGRDREEARRRLVTALEDTVLTGVETNLAFLRDVVASDAFRDVRISTQFLSTSPFGETSEAKPPDKRNRETDLIFAAVARVRSLESDRALGCGAPWDRLGPWRLTRRAGKGSATVVELREEGREAVVLRVEGAGGVYRVSPSPDGDIVVVDLSPKGRGEELRLEIRGVQHRRFFDVAEREVWVGHRRFALVSREDRAVRGEVSAADDPRNLAAPFPGLVTEVAVATGDHVDAGRAIVIMEAMKMVHHLRASGGGVVRAVHCKPGQTVPMGALLVEMEATA